MGIGIAGYSFYSDIVSAVDIMNKPISREVSDKRDEKVEVVEQDPFSMLIVGIDEREGDSGRTDSMIVMTINPENKSSKIISIPRDTRAELTDPNDSSNNTVNKINHAYAYGGIEMTIKSIEDFLNIPIDYYAEINMQGFKDIVDALGGIEVHNKIAFELDGVTLKKGKQSLNGEEALQYARMRKQDPLGDFGRQARQQEVISKIIDKGLSLSSLTKYGDILDALQNNIKTNLTMSDILDIQAHYKPAAETIEKVEVEGEGETFKNDVWYYIVDDETRQAISDELREHLDLEVDQITASSASEDYNS